MLASLALPRLGKEVFLSLYGQARTVNGKIISSLSTMGIFHFEMSPFHKPLFFMCRKHVLWIICLLSSLGRMWGSCHHCFSLCLVLLFRGFVAKQACLVLWLSHPASLSNHYYRGRPYLFLLTIL